jgi:hypothetical protein
MAEKKKSWIEKRDCGKAPHVKVIDKYFAGIKAGSKMLISSPQEIADFIVKIPKKKFIEPIQMREALAKKHKADATCPVTTGIFLRIAAEAALEEFAQGKSASQITPFWRVVGSENTLAKKLSVDYNQINLMKRLAGD